MNKYKEILDNLIESYKDEIINSTTELISIKSFFDNDELPFGSGNLDALNYMLKKSERDGFRVTNLDNKIGFSEIGYGENLIACLAHLDVVPGGEGWTFEPFGKNITDDKILGRGASDNKGPAIACYYALKSLKESGLTLNSRFRFIFGTDEETGFRCIETYKETEEIPTYSLVPDAYFPVTNIEKGILYFDFNKKIVQDVNCELIYFSGGKTPNMVPSKSTIILKSSINEINGFKKIVDEFIKNELTNIDCFINDTTITIHSYGFQTHASMPENGISSLNILMKLLNTFKIPGDLGDFIEFYSSKIGSNINGKNVGIGFEDEKSGKLTLNVGYLTFENNTLHGTIDIRYPISVTYETIVENFKNVSKCYKVNVSNVSDIPPLYVSEDSKLVKVALDTFNDFYGKNLKPVSIGFGTYAHGIENAVAFGPNFPHEESVFHNSNEYIKIDNLINLSKLYARAMYKLSLIK